MSFNNQKPGRLIPHRRDEVKIIGPEAREQEVDLHRGAYGRISARGACMRKVSLFGPINN